MASISLSRDSISRDRATPFSVQEFSELVSSAFNLVPTNSSSSVLPSCSSRPLPQASSGFDTDTDDGYHTRSRDAKAPMSEQSPKSRSAFRVLRQVRSRASAVLRQANAHIASPSVGVDHSARPSISSQRTLQSCLTTSSYSFLSRPPTPIPTPRTGSPFPDLALTRTRSRAKSFTGHLPTSFLKLAKRDARTSSSGRSQPLRASVPVNTEDLPSFFETKGYAGRNPPPPAYSRPATPVPPVIAQQARIHTRLPPLRKAKSASTSLFRGKKVKGPSAEATDSDAAKAQPRSALDWTALDSGDYFTSPRNPPPVPPLPTAPAKRSPDSSTEEPEGELEVPAYVFERRGSATSTCTTSTMASSRSTSSLSERIASMFQTKAKLRARSKLSLAITTGSANSSPSTDSTRTWSPVTPTHGFTFPPSSQAALVYTQPEQSHDTVFEEDASKIGRVLTPEPDPFAKADVAISRFSTDVTPTRPVSPGFKYGSRRGSRQSDRRARKARSDQQGWDFKDSNAETVEEADDVTMVYSAPHRPRTRLPAFVDSPSRSPLYELPSSCSIYPAGRLAASLSPLLIGPAARTRTNLVSRFSMSTDSLPSSHSSFAGPVDGHPNDVDVDANFVFGTPGGKGPIVRDFAQQSPRLKRTTMDLSGSPKGGKSTIARSSTRTSLPSSPSSTHARYAQCAGTIAPAFATTRRQASVRTSASEPPPRVQRPSSPFPLVQGLSDGSPKGQLGLSIELGDDSPTSGELSDMYCGVVVENETIYDDAFEDSFVLSEGQMGHLRIPSATSQDMRRLAEEVCFSLCILYWTWLTDVFHSAVLSMRRMMRSRPVLLLGLVRC
ncbi:hypothetical protein C8Q72DRAFT_771296 [Fomitopsis betulina]|nr:hypothetical protein C8Q72DRAFT_771296 [Fomitopsis betulina]